MALVCQAQEAKPVTSTDHSELAAILSFEAPPTGTMPGGWSGGPPETIFVDDKVVHGGHWSARIERHADSAGNFSALTKSIPIDFSGATVEFRGFLRTEGVSDFAGLWMREDGETPSLAFDNMQKRQLKGTTEWTEYSITLPVHPEARQLFVGALLTGAGKAWADDLQLLVDGKPVWQAPKVDRPQTALDLDHAFDGGSGIVITELTPLQIDNLVMLGKVWGFLKYHHPEVVSGRRHWDYDLFRILPAILAAHDRPAANAALLHWIENLGAVEPCKPCAKLDEADLDFRPDLDWIANETSLSSDLSARLRSIRDNRLPDKQFYVSKVANIGNPSFDHELGYASAKLPDAGFQLLALFRFWNIFEYWSPYRDLVGGDWNSVLNEFIPRVALAKSTETYQMEMMALIARAHDGHANLWSSLQVRPPQGKCQLPVDILFVENQPVISGVSAANPSNLEEPEVKVGDAVLGLDGVPVEKLMENWTPYYAASNDAARLRDIARSMTRGDCGESSIRVRRNDREFGFKIKRVLPVNAGPGTYTHDLPGPTFRLLSKEVAYLKLSSVKIADAAHYIEQADGTKGLIIDIRNYPSEFMVFALGSLLVDSETAFVRFTEGDLSNPGAFHWTQPLSIGPQQPHYSGKIVILVDETSQSQAEYTSMAFRAARGAIVVGSTTAGADGNVSPFALPGGFRTMISGIGVFYPDKAPTQRIGIVPNIEVKPTIAGIRAGRDEVLEEAVRQIMGRQASPAEIEKMAKP
ncbi:MAG: S41 family peptidase [Terriglobales bacterium]